MRFLGNIEAKLDDKGRVFLPATFRKVLLTSCEESMVLRKDIFQQCLVLYPESVWNKQMDALRKRLSRWNSTDQQVFRQFVSDAEFISIDGNGRILIPKRYQQLGGLEQKIKFIGMGDTIEIWGEAQTHEPFMKAEDFAKAIENTLSFEAEDCFSL